MARGGTPALLDGGEVFPHAEIPEADRRQAQLHLEKPHVPLPKFFVSVLSVVH